MKKSTSLLRAGSTLLMLLLLVTSYTKSSAQIISYKDFQEQYEPSKFVEGDVVLEAAKLDPSSSGSAMGKQLKGNFVAGKVGYELAGIVLPYIPRYKLTDVFKQWTDEEILKVLKTVDKEAVLDMVYYLPESTYNAIGPKIKKLKKFKPKKK